MGLWDAGKPEKVEKLKKQFYADLAAENKALKSKRKKVDSACLAIVAFSGAALVFKAFS